MEINCNCIEKCAPDSQSDQLLNDVFRNVGCLAIVMADPTITCKVKLSGCVHSYIRKIKNQVDKYLQNINEITDEDKIEFALHLPILPNPRGLWSQTSEYYSIADYQTNPDYKTHLYKQHINQTNFIKTAKDLIEESEYKPCGGYKFSYSENATNIFIKLLNYIINNWEDVDDQCFSMGFFDLY